MCRETGMMQAGLTALSANQRVDDGGELAADLGEVVVVVLAFAARLDEAAVAEEGQVVADGRLALGAEVLAELGDVALFSRRSMRTRRRVGSETCLSRSAAWRTCAAGRLGAALPAVLARGAAFLAAIETSCLGTG